MKPIILIPPQMDVPFQFYISTIDFALGLILDQKNEVKKEKLVYYLSHNLAIYKTSYVHLKKLSRNSVFCPKFETLLA